VFFTSLETIISSVFTFVTDWIKKNEKILGMLLQAENKTPPEPHQPGGVYDSNIGNFFGKFESLGMRKRLRRNGIDR